MGLVWIKDVRKIAKTDETERKLDKLNTGNSPTEKDDIRAIRGSSYQTGDTSISTGESDNGLPVDGVDGDGAIVAPAPTKASTFGPDVIIKTGDNSFSDTGFQTGGNYGLASKLPSIPTDMSGNVNEQMKGGAAVRTHAQEGANETALQKILDAVDNLDGLTTAQKNEIKSQTTRKWLVENGYVTPGFFTAKDIADKASYVPSKFSSPAAIEYINQNEMPSYIAGIIGFDPDGELASDGNVKSVVVPLGNLKEYVPEISFITPVGWDDPDSPPILENYSAGYFWTTTGLGSTIDPTGLATAASTPQESAEIAATLYTEANPSTPATFSHLEDDDSGGTPPEYPTPDRYITHYSRPIGGDFQLVTVASVCSSTTGYCPVDPPRETAHPDTGTYVLSFLDGKFITNVYDSVAPLKSTVARSIIELAMGDGVTVTDNRKMTIEPSSTGGTIITVKDSLGAFVESNLLDSQGNVVDWTANESEVTRWKPPQI